jgi:murein DD-endopeptidase MepM/ murein hydrolase activator NlpD
MRSFHLPSQRLCGWGWQQHKMSGQFPMGLNTWKRWSFILATVFLLPSYVQSQDWKAVSQLEPTLNGMRLQVLNPHEGPITIYLDNVRLKNLIPNTGQQMEYWVINSQETVVVQEWTVKNRAEVMEADVRVRALPGVEGADRLHSVNQVYFMPFPDSAAVRFDQGFGGHQSHSSPENFHALDFHAPIGTPVVAAREGVIVEQVLTYTQGAPDLALKHRANRIRIMHDDGTSALYAHLDPREPVFPIGARVGVGEVIGFLGNTGYSSGPHLHFVVQAPKNGKLTSLPYRMAWGRNWIPVDHNRGFRPLLLKKEQPPTFASPKDILGCPNNCEK